MQLAEKKVTGAMQDEEAREISQLNSRSFYPKNMKKAGKICLPLRASEIHLQEQFILDKYLKILSYFASF